MMEDILHRFASIQPLRVGVVISFDLIFSLRQIFYCGFSLRCGPTMETEMDTCPYLTLIIFPRFVAKPMLEPTTPKGANNSQCTVTSDLPSYHHFTLPTNTSRKHHDYALLGGSRFDIPDLAISFNSGISEDSVLT